MTLPYVVIVTTPERRSRLDLCIAALRRSTVPFVLVVYENNDGGCVIATRKAVAGIIGEVFLLNDDMIVEPECLEKLRDKFAEEVLLGSEYSVLQPSDNYHPNGEIATAPYLHSDTLKSALCLGYNHYFWDMELAIRARRDGCYCFVPGAKLDHQHVTKGFPDDETYRTTNLNWAHDEALFKAREAEGFPNIADEQRREKDSNHE